MWADALFILGAYLLGSAPHLRFLATLKHIEPGGDYHQDLWHRGGKLFGVLGVLGEFAKGIITILAGKALGFSPLTLGIAGVAAVCGQMWPVFTGFDGEKGNSIGIAVIFSLTLVSALVAIIPVIIALLFRTIPRVMAKDKSGGKKPLVGGPYSRSLPLGMTACFLLLPFIAWYFGEVAEIIWSYAALFLLIMVRRLTAGLRDDLKTGEGTGKIIIRRLLYDRATAGWRK
jgi:acyl phosphate:glycerol-3-phosphate acyltransferase